MNLFGKKQYKIIKPKCNHNFIEIEGLEFKKYKCKKCGFISFFI